MRRPSWSYGQWRHRCVRFGAAPRGASSAEIPQQPVGRCSRLRAVNTVYPVAGSIYVAAPLLTATSCNTLIAFLCSIGFPSLSDQAAGEAAESTDCPTCTSPTIAATMCVCVIPLHVSGPICMVKYARRLEPGKFSNLAQSLSGSWRSSAQCTATENAWSSTCSSCSFCALRLHGLTLRLVRSSPTHGRKRSIPRASLSLGRRRTSAGTAPRRGCHCCEARARPAQPQTPRRAFPAGARSLAAPPGRTPRAAFRHARATGLAALPRTLHAFERLFSAEIAGGAVPHGTAPTGGTVPQVQRECAPADFCAARRCVHWCGATAAHGSTSRAQPADRMGKKGKKTGRDRQDKFYHLAKEQGYRSRAAFKLVQLNKRHDVLSTAQHGVLDLCAAPGGWMQVARKLIPAHAPCVGVDLVPIKPIVGCIALQHDITSESCRAAVKRALQEHHQYRERVGSGQDSKLSQKVDVVLSDGSPNMGAAWIQDAFTQAEVTLAALKLAVEFLTPNGAFVTKVFRSSDYHSLLFVMNQLFAKVYATKPQASRSSSAEIYLVCLGFLAPQKVDPRLLDPKTVFKDLSALKAAAGDPNSSEARAMHALIAGRKVKKVAEGYEDGAVLVHKRDSVLSFIRSSTPIQLLSGVHSLHFDVSDASALEASASAPDASDRALTDAAAAREADGKNANDSFASVSAREMMDLVASMPGTTEEIRELFADLRVLGRREFKKILKWRQAVRKALEEYVKIGDVEDNASRTDSEASPNAERDEEDELDDIRKRVEQRRRRERKRESKLRVKAQRRIDMKMVLPDDELDMPTADGLFSLALAERANKTVRDRAKDSSVPVDSATVQYESISEDEDGLSADERLQREKEESRAAEAGSDSEADPYDAIERQLDILYDEYLDRKGSGKKTKAAQPDDAAAPQDDLEMEVVSDDESVLSSNSDESSGAEDEPGVRGSKRMEKVTELTPEAEIWFSNPIFQQGIRDAGSDARPARDDRKDAPRDSRRTEAKQLSSHDAGNGVDSPSLRATKKQAKSADSEGASIPELSHGAPANQAGAEGRPEIFDPAKYTVDELAEIAAIGKKMVLGGKRARQQLEDDAYNRYMKNDADEIPRWFGDEDFLHSQRIMPVTKAEVDEMKLRIQTLEALPTKKEQEAVARKKMKQARRMEVVRNKANAIVNQESSSSIEKVRAMEALYKNSGVLKKKKSFAGKTYMVASADGTKKQVGKGGRGNRIKYVDKRMLKDKRGAARAAKKAGHKRQKK
ncbi:AdoMet-dependent rRNA methyltransferase SPB1 [Porphyridium purpureum]|uniref:Putative rRNA methyltransferase n=1 Tax=Porphyridium purpureum TaxID=35688 RepID=A0A5J4YIR5_PORPP|nr:AdoMet-dependent rRNA methyltransferase SPB1 [Porphyridium purpureum]|eukprot:POR6645..scf210_14